MSHDWDRNHNWQKLTEDGGRRRMIVGKSESIMDPPRLTMPTPSSGEGGGKKKEIEGTWRGVGV